MMAPTSVMTPPISIRLACLQDVPALERLIPLSVRGLQSAVYSSAQIEAALGLVFAVDRQLIRDRTYFVVEEGGAVIAGGGWSRRRAVCGGDHARSDEDDASLDPTQEPGRVRAFFVHPEHARRGIGRALLLECENAMRAAGFFDAVLVATLAGEPLYASNGYVVLERETVPLGGGLDLPVVRMGRHLGGRDGTP